MDGEYLTMAEIKRRYPNEWVLLDQLKTRRKAEVLGGRVFFHSADRAAVDERLRRIGREETGLFFACRYIGEAILDEEGAADESELRTVR